MFLIFKKVESCRQIHCPSGQHRDENDNCVYTIKRWYLEKCEVSLKLTADTAFDVEEIFTDNVVSLNHKWPKVWTIKFVSKRVLNTTMHHSLYVQMMNTHPKTSTVKLLRNIRMYLKKPWILTVNNGTMISMSAELGFNTNLKSYSISILNKERGNGSQINLPRFSVIYKPYNRFIEIPTFAVTKLYFCEQIELDPSEYEFIHDLYVYNIITDKLLFNGEFTIITSPQFMGKESMERARICLEDSDFVKLEPDNVASSATYVGYIMIPSVITLFFVR